MNAAIVFSAQFGGRDAAALVLPHFRALKAAANSIHIADFPFREFAFILRVDGSVNQYALSGIGNVDIDPMGTYVSVDIGVTEEDRADLPATIVKAILSAPAFIRSSSLNECIPACALEEPLRDLCDIYQRGIDSDT